MAVAICLLWNFPVSDTLISCHHTLSTAQFLECLDYAPYNPLIHMYAAIQLLNLAMQRTTLNRQTATAQGMMFLQNYYHLRMAGYGTLAFAEREKEYTAKGKTMPPPPIDPIHSIIGVEDVDEQAQQEQQKQMSAEAAKTTITQPPAKILKRQQGARRLPMNGHDGDSIATSSISTEGSKPVETSASVSSSSVESATVTTTTTTTQIISASSEDDDDLPLAHSQQEAEYNFARCFHHMGQNHLAIVHYRRVLELPSWREVQREHEALRKRREAEEKQRRRDKDNEEDLDSDEEEDDQVKQKASRSEEGLLPRIQLQGANDDDPTDLKREAAFNLAKIYINSGAMGEAQLLMRKYCTV